MGLLREKVKHYDLTWGASSRRAAICRGTAAWLAGRLAKADTLAFSKGCRMNPFTKALSELQQATQALDLATVAAITDLIAEAGAPLGAIAAYRSLERSHFHLHSPVSSLMGRISQKRQRKKRQKMSSIGNTDALFLPNPRESRDEQCMSPEKPPFFF